MERTDTEILEWLIEEMKKDGAAFCLRHDWFFNGEPVSDLDALLGPHPHHGKFEALKANGSLVLKETGYLLQANLGIEWSDTIGEGATCRDALVAAMNSEEAGR